jgi:hypothetical protein
MHAMTSETPELPDIPSWAINLTGQLKALVVAVRELSAGLQRNRLAVHVIAGILVVDIILTAAVGWALYQQYRTRVTILCPLYSVIVSANKPQTRAAGPDRDAYIAGYQIINQAYAELDCPLPPLPPAVSGAPPPK